MDNPIIRAYACLSIPWRQVRLTKQKTAQKAKEGKMWEWIGLSIFSFGFVVILIKYVEDFKTSLIVVIMLSGVVITTLSRGEKGGPKTSIETGDYSIVSYAETVFGNDQPMYQMILKQNNRIEFYALPKNMVTINKSNGSPGTLEVIEKAGSKKAIMRP